ncbi:hypothetical protein Emag_002710 [Eimeria magna]
MRASSLIIVFLSLSAARAWAAAPAESQVSEVAREVKEGPELRAEEATVHANAHSAPLVAPENPELQKPAASAPDIAIEEEAQRKGGEKEQASMPSAPEGGTPAAPLGPAKETPSEPSDPTGKMLSPPVSAGKGTTRPTMIPDEDQEDSRDPLEKFLRQLLMSAIQKAVPGLPFPAEAKKDSWPGRASSEHSFPNIPEGFQIRPGPQEIAALGAFLSMAQGPLAPKTSVVRK